MKAIMLTAALFSTAAYAATTTVTFDAGPVGQPSLFYPSSPDRSPAPESS